MAGVSGLQGIIAVLKIMNNVNCIFMHLFLSLQHWGYTRFTANTTTLMFEYVHNDGHVPDSFVLKKDEK